MSNGDCWLGNRTLTRQTVSDRAVARGQTEEFLEEARGSSLAQRTVQVPGETANPAPTAEGLFEILCSRSLPLKLTPELTKSKGIIDFDVVKRGGYCCLEPGSKHQVYYLGENESCRDTIDLPNPPGPGAPRYFLAPCLRNDLIGIDILDNCIQVFRQRLGQELTIERGQKPPVTASLTAFLLVPEDVELAMPKRGEMMSYRRNPAYLCAEGVAPESSNASDFFLLGQYEHKGWWDEGEWVFKLRENYSYAGCHNIKYIYRNKSKKVYCSNCESFSLN